MSDETMLKCLIAFILGWLVSRHMGNGFSIGGQRDGTADNIENLILSFPPSITESSHN